MATNHCQGSSALIRLHTVRWKTSRQRRRVVRVVHIISSSRSGVTSGLSVKREICAIIRRGPVGVDLCLASCRTAQESLPLQGALSPGVHKGDTQNGHKGHAPPKNGGSVGDDIFLVNHGPRIEKDDL